MKTRLFISLLVVAMGVMIFSGCTKYSECSCENIFDGYLYLIQKEVYDCYSGSYVTTSAILSEIPISDSEKQNINEYDSNIRCVYGNLPRKVKDMDGCKVRCCISQKEKARHRIVEGRGVGIVTINCIETK